MGDKSENISELRNVFVEVFGVVGHDEQEAQQMADKFIVKIYQIAGVLLSKKKGESEMAEIAEKLELANSREEVESEMVKLYGMKDFWTAFSQALVGVWEYYLNQIKGQLSVDQKSKISQLFGQLRQAYE